MLIFNYAVGSVVRWMYNVDNWTTEEIEAALQLLAIEVDDNTVADFYHNATATADLTLDQRMHLRWIRDMANSVETATAGSVDTYTEKKIADLEAALHELQANPPASETIYIKKYDGTERHLKNTTLPKVFHRVLALAQARRNILLVGPAGCGKTYLGKLTADAMSVYFGTMSCTAGMSEAHLVGRNIPNLTTGRAEFQGTEFLKCYEEGGVFLLDEIDAADSNLLLIVNAALANGRCNVPARMDNPYAIRHPDFVMMATANTFGRGANRMYAGRNALDEATLDRFRIGTVECYYDEKVEEAVCPDTYLRQTLQAVRRQVEEAGLRRLVSTRFLKDAYIMKREADWTKEDIMEVLFSGWTMEEKAKISF